MSRRNDWVTLKQMVDHAVEAIELTQEEGRESLDQNRLLELGLVRLVEIVGEAAGRISLETQARHPQIPWPQIISMRNRLVHGYDSVDLDILWQTIHEDLPPLIEMLEAILAKRAR